MRRGPHSAVGGGGGLGCPPRKAHPMSHIVGRNSFPPPERSEDLGTNREFRKFRPPVVHVSPASEGGESMAVPGQARQWIGDGFGSKGSGGEERKKKLRSQLNVTQ